MLYSHIWVSALSISASVSESARNMLRADMSLRKFPGSWGSRRHLLPLGLPLPLFCAVGVTSSPLSISGSLAYSPPSKSVASFGAGDATCTAALCTQVLLWVCTEPSVVVPYGWLWVPLIMTKVLTCLLGSSRMGGITGWTCLFLDFFFSWTQAWSSEATRSHCDLRFVPVSQEHCSQSTGI